MDVRSFFHSLVRVLSGYALLGAAICLSLPAHAQEEPKEAKVDEPLTVEELRVSTPMYRSPVPDYNPGLGTYIFTASWQGIPAATVTVTVKKDGQSYHIESTAKTYKAIDIFYRLRYRATGVISALDFSPRKTVIDQRENSRVKLTTINFADNGHIHAVRERKGRETKELKFNPANFTLDPFSAAFLARGLDWRKGDTKVFDTFDGKNRYLVSLTAVDKTQMMVNETPRQVWIVEPRVRKLTTLEPNKKLRSARIYMTADSRRELLKIESEVFIGTVTTELVEYRPLPEPLDAQIAHRASRITIR